MATVPQKELRNHVGEVLRRAEAGEEITITVSGRPVAQLGPARTREWVPSGQLTASTRCPSTRRRHASGAGCTRRLRSGAASHEARFRPCDRATANVNRVPLLTYNAKDFEIVEDLVDVRRPS